MNTVSAIGVDLGGSNLRAALVEFGGQQPRIVRQGRMAVGDRHPQSVAEMLAALVRELGPSSGPPPAVGIGLAGMLSAKPGLVVSAPNLSWRDVDFGAMVQQRLGRSVWLENDLNAICWGEARFGAALGTRNALCVFIGTGIGAGLVVNGQLYRGASNVAGEIGHVKTVPGGRVCGCGARGCLEAYAGGRHLAEQARAEPSKLLLELAGGDRHALHAGHLDAAARRGDGYAKSIIDPAARMIGQVLANAITLLNCDTLLMGGTVWSGCDALRAGCLRQVKQLTNLPAHDALQIVEWTLGDTAGVFGAADLARAELANTASTRARAATRTQR